MLAASSARGPRRWISDSASPSIRIALRRPLSRNEDIGLLFKMIAAPSPQTAFRFALTRRSLLSASGLAMSARLDAGVALILARATSVAASALAQVNRASYCSGSCPLTPSLPAAIWSRRTSLEDGEGEPTNWQGLGPVLGIGIYGPFACCLALYYGNRTRRSMRRSSKLLPPSPSVIRTKFGGAHSLVVGI